MGSFALSQALAAGNGIVRLGATRLSVNDVATSIISWTDVFEQLILAVAIPNYAGADVGSLQFGNGNGVVDTGTNYWNRALMVAAGQSLVTDPSPQASDTMIRLGVAGGNGRSALIHVTNFANKNKVAKASVTLNSSSAATIPDSHISVEGAWFNTTDAIKSVRLALPGAGKLGAGSQIIVFGMNAA
jgi:hypothetical protein